jgi:hypothetical protein
MSWFDENGGGSTYDMAQLEQQFMALVAGKPPTKETLDALRPQLQQMGIELIPNADGTKYDFRLPDGRFIDAVYGFGGPLEQRHWQWLDDGYPYVMTSGGGTASQGYTSIGGFEPFNPGEGWTLANAGTQGWNPNLQTNQGDWWTSVGGETPPQAFTDAQAAGMNTWQGMTSGWNKDLRQPVYQISAKGKMPGPNGLTYSQVGGSSGMGGQSGSSYGGPGSTSPYASGAAIEPWLKQFQAPSQEDALNTPGVQFAMDRAMQALQRSAAAKGTLVTGGLLRDLSDQQIGMSMQSYGDIYNRSMGEYMLERDNFFQNQDRPFDKFTTLADLGKPT